MTNRLRFFVIVLLLPCATLAVQPKEMLTDPAMEARARNIGADLRCLVCQNQSIDDSDADLAHDLRVLVRQRLQAGDSNAQVKQYIVNRYGDYVLLNPPFKAATFALWLGPLALLLAAIMAARFFYRHSRKISTDSGRALSPEEKKRLAALLDPEHSEGKSAP